MLAEPVVVGEVQGAVDRVDGLAAGETGGRKPEQGGLGRVGLHEVETAGAGTAGTALKNDLRSESASSRRMGTTSTVTFSGASSKRSPVTTRPRDLVERPQLVGEKQPGGHRGRDHPATTQRR